MILMADVQPSRQCASAASLVSDDQSQILALRDALASANRPAILRAFREVAQSRGITQLANIAGIPEKALHKALASPDRLDVGLLERLVVRLEVDTSINTTNAQTSDQI